MGCICCKYGSQETTELSHVVLHEPPASEPIVLDQKEQTANPIHAAAERSPSFRSSLRHERDEPVAEPLAAEPPEPAPPDPLPPEPAPQDPIPPACYAESMSEIQERLFLGNAFAAGAAVSWPYPPAEMPRDESMAWEQLQPTYQMPRAAARDFLRRWGITHIVALSDAPSLFSARALEPEDEPAIRYEMAVFGDEPGDRRMLASLDSLHGFIDQTLRRERNSAILVHCDRGQSRSVAVIVSFVMRKRRLGFDAAFRLVQEKRCQVLPHMFMFEEQLREYERQIDVEEEEPTPDWSAIKYADNVIF